MKEISNRSLSVEMMFQAVDYNKTETLHKNQRKTNTSIVLHSHRMEISSSAEETVKIFACMISSTKFC